MRISAILIFPACQSWACQSGGLLANLHYRTVTSTPYITNGIQISSRELRVGFPYKTRGGGTILLPVPYIGFGGGKECERNEG
jgi:hypothetical protein